MDRDAGNVPVYVNITCTVRINIKLCGLNKNKCLCNSKWKLAFYLYM